MIVEYTCPACNGSGEGMYDGTRCRQCNGTGVEAVEEPDTPETEDSDEDA